MPEKSNRIQFFIPSYINDPKTMLESCVVKFDLKKYNFWRINKLSSEESLSHSPGCIWEVLFRKQLSIQQIDSIGNSIINQLSLNRSNVDHTFVQVYSNPGNEEFSEQNFDYVVIRFDNYKEIRKFQKYFEKKLSNTSKLGFRQIQEKVVFRTVDEVANMSLFILLFFSIFSASILFSAVLRNHLLRIRKNIGSFLAFGLQQQKLLSIYALVLFQYIIFTLALSFVLSLPGLILFSDELEFRSSNSLYLLVSIVLFSFGITMVTVTSIIKKTPGELIYNR